MSMTKKLIRENLLSGEFALGVIVPIALFSILDHYGATLAGSLTAGIWSIGVIGVGWLRKRTINIFAEISAALSAIGLVGVAFSGNPMFYMVSPIVFDVILAAAFLSSMACRKPLLQLMAEHTVKNGFSETIRNRPDFRTAWVILSLGWGILSLSQAAVRIVLLHFTPLAVYYAASSTYGSVSTPLLMIFSFWFPGWYWRRNSRLLKGGAA